MYNHNNNFKNRQYEESIDSYSGIGGNGDDALAIERTAL